MLSLEQAAKFLVVAWVKDWPMRTLADAIEESGGKFTDERLAALVDAVPFMPTHIHWYISKRGAGVSTRHFVADAFPKLSSALWAATDNEARLKMASQIQRLQAGDVKASRRMSKEDVAERQKASREASANTTEYWLRRTAGQTHARSAWNVCKA